MLTTEGLKEAVFWVEKFWFKVDSQYYATVLLQLELRLEAEGDRLMVSWLLVMLEESFIEKGVYLEAYEVQLSIAIELPIGGRAIVGILESARAEDG